MPDDGRGKKEDGERGSSLVERAMRKSRLARTQKKVGVSAVEAAVEMAEATKPDPRETGIGTVGAQADEAPAGGITADSPEPKPAGLDVPGVTLLPCDADGIVESETGAATKVAPGARHRVDVDFDRMRERGFITPNWTRTRTTEEFRLIKRALLQGVSAARNEGKRHPNLVMVTSALPSEGKTFNAINLAISIASEPDLNTLLIDADLVNPTVFRTLGIEAGRGLIDIIESDDRKMADVLTRTNIDGMTLLGAGTPHPMATELLSSDRMRRFVDEVAQRYNDRIVIFDAPPILVTSEAAALSEHMNQIVFVIEADRTSRTRAKEALDMIGPGPKIGLVLNKATSQIGKSQFGAYYKAYSKAN